MGGLDLTRPGADGAVLGEHGNAQTEDGRRDEAVDQRALRPSDRSGTVTGMAPAPDEVDALLLPYQGLQMLDAYRFVDTPPSVVRQVLGTFDEWWTTSRANGQPPAGWLVDEAERLGGLLGGHYSPDPRSVRVDAICVPGERAPELVGAVARDWPDDDTGMGASAVELALAEEWPAWDAERSTWEGRASELLERPAAAVAGLWWD